MRLVIEDDSGAAWYVVENIEEFNLNSQEDRDQVVNSISETMDQIQEETADYEKIRDMSKEEIEA